VVYHQKVKMDQQLLVVLTWLVEVERELVVDQVKDLLKVILQVVEAPLVLVHRMQHCWW
jgi:hypothetical protein